jgi:hypothetical protein
MALFEQRRRNDCEFVDVISGFKVILFRDKETEMNFKLFCE